MKCDLRQSIGAAGENIQNFQAAFHDIDAHKIDLVLYIE